MYMRDCVLQVVTTYMNILLEFALMLLPLLKAIRFYKTSKICIYDL